MSENDLQLQKQLAMRIAANASASEKEAIRQWIDRLLVVRASQLSSLQKAKLAISVTADSQVILPSVKIIGREMKRLAWDDRSVKARFGLGGTAIALAVFGGEGAGIAALGTGIGVPLWVVFGAGATFLGVLYEEITGKKVEPKTTYTVIDAERKEQEQGGRGKVAGAIEDHAWKGSARMRMAMTEREPSDMYSALRNK